MSLVYPLMYLVDDPMIEQCVGVTYTVLVSFDVICLKLLQSFLYHLQILTCEFLIFLLFGLVP